MRFIWHHALWLLLALPALIGSYVVLLRRRGAAALRYSSDEPASTVAGYAERLRPHVPPLLLLAGLGVLLLSAARPVLIVTTPSEQGTVVLLIDVSLSMAATDVPPTRLAAARSAAIEFVKAQPRDVRVAVVAFGGYADVRQMPTANREDILGAIDRLELQRFTAIGNGLIGAILTLVPTAGIGEEYDIFGSGGLPGIVYGVPLEQRAAASAKPRRPAAPGSYLSAAIILVSDGRGTMGVAPEKAAKMAADLGIRVYTVGVGTLYGGVANVEGWPTIYADFDEELLKRIAGITGGEYFLARTAEKVKRIYDTLGRRVVLERAELEITALCTAIGVILTLAAAGLSLVWWSRVRTGSSA